MHINKHNPYQNFKSMSSLSCMLSKSSICHVMNVLDILSHTDWFQVVCCPRESCQHQTRAGFHWGGDNGLLEGLGGLPRVRGGSQQSHIYLLSIAFVNMDPPVHLTSPLSSLSWRVYALRTIFLPCAEGRSQFQSLVWCRLQKWLWIWSTNESSVKLHTNCCQGEVVFILSLEDCVRGQHVCLADAERSSSFCHFFRTAWEGNTSAWLMRRGRLHTLKQTNNEVSCDFFWHWTQTVIDCIVEN